MMKLTGFSAPRDCESCRPPARAAAKAETRTARESSALKLTLKTAEGDTVEISLEARSLRQSERASARGPGARAAHKSDSRSDSFTASVNVAGDLSDAEMEDIQSLLQQLASGEAPQAGDGDLDTISAYQFSLQRTREVSRSQVEVFA